MSNLEKAVIATEANWKNRTLFIGDNLDVMRAMNSGTIDLIYLDPPFNSKRLYQSLSGTSFKDFGRLTTCGKWSLACWRTKTKKPTTWLTPQGKFTARACRPT